MRKATRWNTARALLGLPALVILAVACADGPTATGPTAYEYVAPPDLGDGLGGAHAGTVGIDFEPLEEMVGEIEQGLWPNIHSVLIYRDQHLILEEYFSGTLRSDSTFREFGRDTLHDMFSVSKSFTSAAVGLAIASGAITGVDQPVADFFPDYVHLGGSLASGALRVRHLLAMSAGYAWDESSTDYEDAANTHLQLRNAADPLEFIFSRTEVAAPGAAFAYNTGLTALLGEIVARATGRSIADFMADELFDPLGVTDYHWLDYYAGDLAFAGGGLQLRPRDMVKLGVVYMNGGAWQLEQVVPQAWVQASTSQQGPSESYGYQWWLGQVPLDGQLRSFFRAAGLGGQHILVFPFADLVVVFTGNGSGTGPFVLLQTYLIPALL